ncbi:uncharacterized protein PY1_contig-05-31 [Novosphingobium sp. PY1]|nr:uncharacterized protein PY1_contig-05-31 [Novosphingobium sp. PY1]
MRIVGIPVIDCDPLKIGLEIAGHAAHQLARENAQVIHLRGVLGTDDEAEVMPVVFAALGESIAVSFVTAGIEHRGVPAIPGDTIAFEIRDMATERRSPESRALVPDNAGLDDNAAGIGTQPHPGQRAASSRAVPGAFARLPCELCKAGPCTRTADLRGKALGLTRRAASPVPARPWSRPKMMIVACHHTAAIRHVIERQWISTRPYGWICPVPYAKSRKNQPHEAA